MSRSATADAVAIVGAGQFGTSLAHRISSAGREVILWSRDGGIVSEINRQRTSARLPGVTLPATVRATEDPAELARSARFVVIAVSSTSVAERARVLGDHIDGSHILVHALGALVPRESDMPSEPSDGDHLLVSEVLRRETPALRVGALAGPALWPDLVSGRFASMVVASGFDEVALEGRRLLGIPPALRIYRGSDLAGVELAAALAGAYTVAVGMSDGLGLGPGPRAVLITRALAEAARLGRFYGAQERTFSGLAGLGNLMVRTRSEHSRDYQLGLKIAKGELPQSPDALTEGARAARAALRLAERHEARTPVLEGVVAVLAGKLTPERAASAVADTVAPQE